MIECKNQYYDLFDQMKNGASYQLIHQNIKDTKQSFDEADNDRVKLVQQLETQIDLAISQRKEIEELKA